MRIPAFRSILLCALLIAGSVFASQACAEAREKHEWKVLDLPSMREQEIGIGFWALVIAKECDSTVNIDQYLSMLDSMAADIRRMVGPREGDIVRFMMTRLYQFEPGEWNDYQTFSYDLDDPMGEQPGAPLLSTYLDTRKGNCVSMPTLFLALMERVTPETPFHGVTAPLHMFCRLRDRQEGKVWNVECTNGGNGMRDEWVIDQFGISSTAIDSGTYLRNLTKKEYVGELLGILVSRFRRAGEYDEALNFSELMLELNPKSISGLVQKGSLLAWLGYNCQEMIRAEGRSPTEPERLQLELFSVESAAYIARARSLGWEPETDESRQQYLKAIKQARLEDIR